MEPEETDIAPRDDMEDIVDFERELRIALARRTAPPYLKRKIVERRRQHAGRPYRMIWLERLAASLILAAVVGGAAFWRHQVEQRRGEEAKQQVFTALRIANHALEQMNAQLAEHNRDAQ
ncbi:MAG TPA: hypothetical protein VJX73_08810 [Terracidiphilus sp.]|nr:hypothetical protein [Terracidiphilus sp.]